MAERIDNKKKVNSVWSWVKDIFNQVDIEESTARDFKGISAEENASLMMGEKLADEVLVTYTELGKRTPENKIKNNVKVNQVYPAYQTKNGNVQKNSKIKYIDTDREDRVK